MSIEQHREWNNVYAITRAAARDLGTAWHEHRGVDTSYVRCYNVFGPRQYLHAPHPQKLVPTFADRAWRGLPLPVFGTGKAIIDLTYSLDVARVFADVLAMEDGEDTTFDAGTGVPLTVLDLAEFVLRHTGSEAGVEHLPMRLGETEHQRAPVSEGRGWDRLPAPPQLRWEDVASTVDWYRTPRP